MGEYLQIISHIKIRGQCRDYMKKPINSYRKDKKSNYKCSVVFSGYSPPPKKNEKAVSKLLVKTLNITGHEKNENKNHKEKSFHTPSNSILKINK